MARSKDVAYPSEHGVCLKLVEEQLEWSGGVVKAVVESLVLGQQSLGSLWGVVRGLHRGARELGRGLGLVEEVPQLRHPHLGHRQTATRSGLVDGLQTVASSQTLQTR